jgi:hypothetical protein
MSVSNSFQEALLRMRQKKHGAVLTVYPVFTHETFGPDIVMTITTKTEMSQAGLTKL